MIVNPRAAIALLSCLIVASSARAATDLDAAFNRPDDARYSPLLGVAASSSASGDQGALLASADSPAANNSAASEASDQNPCGGCDGCSSCLDCCPLVWGVSAGAVFLHRDRPTAGTIVGAEPNGTPAFSRGSDFDFGWDAGPDITIARRFGCCDSLEARFFNSDDSANTQFVTPGAFIGAGFTGPGGTTISGHDLTKFDSLEINWRHQQGDHLALLAGFRALELNDDLSYNIGPVANGDYRYINHLYGGQLGADWALSDRSSPLQLDIVGKAGVFGNTASGGITQSVGGTPVQSFMGRDSSAAFVGEIDFSAAYILSKHVAIHGGYQLLWLSDLALSTDAASRSLVNPSLLTTVGDDGHLFDQGATVGLDYVW